MTVPDGRCGALALSWSGGKDSALALHELCGAVQLALVTTITADYERISMHGVRRELLAVRPTRSGWRWSRSRSRWRAPTTYMRQRFGAALGTGAREVGTVAFGDIFLEDLRAYREDKLGSAGRSGLFPLWKRDTTELAHEFIDAGFEAIVAASTRASSIPRSPAARSTVS